MDASKRLKPVLQGDELPTIIKQPKYCCRGARRRYLHWCPSGSSSLTSYLCPSSSIQPISELKLKVQQETRIRCFHATVFWFFCSYHSFLEQGLVRTAVLCVNLSVFVAGAVLKRPPVKRNGFDLSSAVMDGKVYPVQVPKGGLYDTG